MEIPKNITPIGGHVSEETAYIVTDYPYGRLRAEMRFWVESRPKFGQRLVMQSVNPKTGRVNKPHPGNYHAIVVLFINNENNHCEHWVLSPYNNTKAELENFSQVFGGVVTDEQKKTLRNLYRSNVFVSPVSFFQLNDEQGKAITEMKSKLMQEFPHKEQLTERSKTYLQRLELIIGFAPIPA
jgi:hypothetical protein